MNQHKSEIDSSEGPMPKVSICCMTFNHGNYIEDTLNGFLFQETNFDYEILIHDDASEDQTVETLKRFRDLFPEKINLILQSENKYSRGIKIAKEYLWPKAKGEFVALCEGDDYWTDKYKLQKQVDSLMQNEEINLCVHAVIELDILNGTETVNKKTNTVHIYSFSEVIAGGGAFFSTASILIRKKVLDSLPSWFDSTPVSDYFIQVLGSANGALYLPEAMAVYRKFAEGSWSVKFKEKNSDQLVSHFRKMDNAMENLNIELGNKYTPEISWVRTLLFLSGAKRCLIQGNYTEALKFIGKALLAFAKIIKAKNYSN